ncbi:hypothetical protein MIN45_P0657 [Methylomarinovum tepidoasis]|uniref:Uncharacterized protein n=1 Tax=Methylomarinovum tepidoasis TaxID=2840183 RepID=A0AAU9BXT7_9GAMM|nr:efflux RND transporter permease subunit [Methylomarinovum sp. IN45]BCX88288.1 hypothetical protein MIN45_P0657 [Methylomarinovum sp. IN45]
MPLGRAPAQVTVPPENDRLAAALESNNRNDGTGCLETGEESLIVRSHIQTLEDVRHIVVAERSGMPMRVGDVAEVRIGALTRYGALSADGEGETVEGLALSLRGTNAGQVVKAVQAKLGQLEAGLPPGARIRVLYDRGKLVTVSVRGPNAP